MYIILYNVTDTRTGLFHSEVMVKNPSARFFLPGKEGADALDR